MGITFEDIRNAKELPSDDVINILNSIVYLNKLYYLPISEITEREIENRLAKKGNIYGVIFSIVEDAVEQLFHHHRLDFRGKDFGLLVDGRKLVAKIIPEVRDKTNQIIDIGLRCKSIQEVINLRYLIPEDKARVEDKIIESIDPVVQLLDDVIGSILKDTKIEYGEPKNIVYYPGQFLDWIYTNLMNRNIKPNSSQTGFNTLPHVLEKYNPVFIKEFKEKIKDYFISAHSIDGK